MRRVSIAMISMLFLACGDKTQANKPTPQPAPKSEPKSTDLPKTEPTKTPPVTSTATPPAPVATGALEKTVLYDGRLLNQADGGVKIQQIERGKPAVGLDGAALAKIEAAVFPKKLASIEACKGDDEGTIANGQFVANLSAVTEEAAFTAADKKQTLYMYDVEFCNGIADGNVGYLVIAEKDNVVFKGQRDFSTLERALDVTGDGLLDVMIAGGGVGQGVLVMSGELVSFAGGAAASLKRFDDIIEDLCGADETASTNASVLYFQRDASNAVSYTEEHYSASCKDPKAFSLKK